MSSALPGISQSISDGALGFGRGFLARDVWIVFGTSQSGTAATLYGPYFDGQACIDEVGDGEGPEMVAWLLQVDKTKPVYFGKVNGSVAGTSGSVTQTGTGPALTPGGAPYFNLSVKVKVVKGGALATATIKVALNGGDYGAETLTAASVTVPRTGLSLGLAAGTYVADEEYTFTTTAPGFVSADLTAVYDVADVAGFKWAFGYVVGQAAGATDTDKATAAATIFSAMSSKLATSATNGRRHNFLLELPDVADNSTGDGLLNTALLSLSQKRITFCYGFCDHISAVSQRKAKRSSGWVLAGRIRVNRLRRNPAAFADGVAPTADTSASITAIYHDENKRPGPGVRFATLRKHEDQTGGFFITNWPTMAAPGSDFTFGPNMRVVDAAADITRPKGLTLLAGEVETYPNPPPAGKTAGTLTEGTAQSIEKLLEAELDKGLVKQGEVISARVTVNRAEVTATTFKVKYKTRLKAWDYAFDVEEELGLEQ